MFLDQYIEDNISWWYAAGFNGSDLDVRNIKVCDFVLTRIKFVDWNLGGHTKLGFFLIFNKPLIYYL